MFTDEAKGNKYVQPQAGFLSRFTFAFLMMFIVWLAFTETLALSELITGIILSAIVASLTWRFFTFRGLANFHPKRVAYLLAYALYLFYAMIVANLDVAYRVLHPKRPIKPGFVIVKTKLKSSLGKAVLGNSITLTPGTMTMDYFDDELVIHWLYVHDESVDGASKRINRPFERFLEVIFE